jgi:hypothetical protein
MSNIELLPKSQPIPQECQEGLRVLLGGVENGDILSYAVVMVNRDLSVSTCSHAECGNIALLGAISRLQHRLLLDIDNESRK